MFHSVLRPAAQSPAQRGSGVVQRFGFTILEVMIVLMLLVAITGLVMPSVLNRLGDSLAQSALDQIEATASECRSKAQQDGNALRLIAKERTDGTVGLYIEEIGESDLISTDDGAGSSGGETSENADRGRRGAFSRTSSSPLYVLPAEFSFSRSLPLVDEGIFNDPSVFRDISVGGGSVEADSMEGPIANVIEMESMTLAVYLPDGTAIVERPLYLKTIENTYEIEISRWTGRVTTQRVRRDNEVQFDGEESGDGFFESESTDASPRGRAGGGP